MGSFPQKKWSSFGEDYLWKIHRRTTAPIIQLLNPWPRIRGIMMAGLLGPAMNATETVMASHAGNLRKDDPLQGDQPIYHDGIYNNPWSTWKRKSSWLLLKWLLTTSWNKSPKPTDQEIAKYYPVVSPWWDRVYQPRSEDLQVTWIGHSTFLVQMDGVNFLTDPIWSQRCSPSQLVGPKRFRPPPFPISKLPPIDFVIVSHNHYDHLDLATVLELGNAPKWYVPKGMKEWFTSQGIDNVVELSWWQRHQFNANVSIWGLPVQHWSKRTLRDAMHSLWQGAAVVGPKHNTFFAGDTGYCSAFSQIGAKLGPFDLSLLPIGAYCPGELMQSAHVNPAEAVQMHRDLRSRKSVGMHYGTFILTSEHLFEPPAKLQEELRNAKVPAEEFITIKHGETRIISRKTEKGIQVPLKEDEITYPLESSA